MKLWDEVVVHTRTDQSFRGVVRKHRGRWIVLSKAALLSGPQPVELDGEVLIPRENVNFAQRTTVKGDQP